MTADRYRHLADHFESLVANVPEDRWSAASPCAEWDARGVVGHIVGVHGMMIKPLERELSPAPSVDDDPLGALQSARRDVQEVLDDPALAGKEYDGFFGRTSVGATIDRFMCFDLVVHGWDLARATGQDDTMDPTEVRGLLDTASSFGDAIRSPGVCGPEIEVGPDASDQDRVLAFLGRDPNWQA